MYGLGVRVKGLGLRVIECTVVILEHAGICRV